jgi:hypothetical protein
MQVAVVTNRSVPKPQGEGFVHTDRQAVSPAVAKLDWSVISCGPSSDPS